MEHMDEQEVERLKVLLQRAAEFISYFECADTKMHEWRYAIEQQAENQKRQFQAQLQALQVALEPLQTLVTQAGLSHFRMAAEQALCQGQEALDKMSAIEKRLDARWHETQETLSSLSDECTKDIHRQSIQALERINAHLAQYDPQQFYRIANESCEMVQRSSTHVILKSGKLLRMFQWRTVALVFLTSLLTAFCIGLYMSDEFPWEIHQHAMNERGAGKMLMNAWPKLTYQEKVKILGEQSYQKS